MSWDDAEKRFAEALPNFKPRPQQRLLATSIEEALVAGTTIIGQGGCGVGKSFALMVPLIDYALDTGCTVAISTATKALQDQYVNKDVPFLQDTLGRPFTAAVLKGRGNYVCRAKLAELKPGEVSGGGELLQELADDETHSGDLADIVTPIDPRDRPKLVSSSDECPGKRECFTGETRYLTFDGVRTLAETVDTTQRILTNGGVWKDAEIKRFGRRQVWQVTLRRNKRTKVVYATEGHRWFRQALHNSVRSRREELTTADLRPGMSLTKMFPHTNIARATPSQFGIAHGVVYGDGTIHQRNAEVELWGEKDAQLIRYFSESVMHPVKTDNELGMKVVGLPRYFKALPDLDEASSYLYGWLAGYFAADGHVTKQGQAVLYSADKDSLEYVRTVAHRLGIGTYGITTKTRLGKGTKPSELHGVQFLNSTLRPEFFLIAEHRVRYDAAVARGNAEQTRWVVDSVELTDQIEDVYCAVVPGTQSFTLEDNILVGNCPFGDVCFAERAKQRASEANLIIVNHAALISDLKIKEEGGFGILPELGAVGIDESHELESYATNALGSEFTQRGIQNLAGEVTNVLGQEAQNQVGALLNATEKLFKHLSNLLERSRDRTTAFGDREVLDAEALLGPFLQGIMGIKRVAEGFAAPAEINPVRVKRLKKRINSMLRKAQSVIFASSADMIRWVESDDRRGVVLKYAPLHVGDFLRSMIWDQMPAALVSATVAIGDDFSFVAERHGIEEYRSVDAGSPFDFERQATLYVPQNVDPSGDPSGWKTALRIQGLELIRAAGGRTLLLFSAKTNMKAAHEALAPSLKKLGLRVLIQGEGTTRALTEAFRADETSVLFGLKSFATGFDIQGDALRLVIIDKMPFPVPTDVIFKARCDAIDAKKTGWNDGSFMKLSVPSMALDLLQGAGRLIRTLEDEGQIVIFDSRLLTKGYGKKILRALPPARRVGTLPEAGAYLEDLSTRRG